MSRCLITGIVIVDESYSGGRACRADLYRIGDVWLANLAMQGLAWEYGEDVKVASTEKQLIISAACPGAGILERGSMLAVHHDWAALNSAAIDYLAGAPVGGGHG